MEMNAQEIHEPGRDWWRAFFACLVGAALVLGLAGLMSGIPVTPGLAIAVAVAIPILAFLATLAVAGAPWNLGTSLEIRDGVIVLDGPNGLREIPRDRLLDLRPGALVLDDGERLRLPDVLLARLRLVFREALLARIRGPGRVYEHDQEPPRLAVRLAVGYLAAFATGVLIVGIGLALQAGGLGSVAGVALGLGVWIILWRSVTRRREDRARAEAILSVTLDEKGVRIVEANGDESRIPWDEIEDVPPLALRDPLIIETEDLLHTLPRSFHPSLARDLRAAWSMIVTEDDESTATS
jgi:hypothetical protein